MTIKIVLPEGDGPKSGHGTKVFTDCGTEIKDISQIKIEILPDCILQAQITVGLSGIENLSGIEGVFIVDQMPSKKPISLFEKIINLVSLAAR